MVHPPLRRPLVDRLDAVRKPGERLLRQHFARWRAQ
jgi:hypothetical protein